MYRLIFEPDYSRIMFAVLVDNRASIPAIKNQVGSVIKTYVDSQIALITDKDIVYKIETDAGNIVGFFTITVNTTNKVATFGMKVLRPAFHQYEVEISTTINTFIEGNDWAKDFMFPDPEPLILSEPPLSLPGSSGSGSSGSGSGSGGSGSGSGGAPPTEQYHNTYQTFTASAPAGYENEDITYSLPANNISSHTSPEDANEQALDYCESLATGTMLRTMKPTNPYIGGGFNETQGKGSIDKDSNILILEESMGFQVNDYLIIETGGESGEGLRGTIGVGGQWPYTVYDTTEELLADHTQVSGFYAGSIEDGITYRYDGTDWILYTQWKYYTEKIIPHNLDARITAVSVDGKTITLNKTAVVDSVNANIYFDHHYLFQSLFVNETVIVPEGKFAISWHIDMTDDTRLLQGAGKDKSIIFSPNGSPSATVRIWEPHSVYGIPVIKDLTIIGNNRKDGFRFMESEFLEPFPTSGYLGNDYLFLQTPAVWMSAKFARAENIKVIDPMGYGFESNTGSLTIDNCNVILTEGEQMYQGWYFHVAGANVDDPWTEVKNCTFVSPTLTHAWESFRSEKTIFSNIKSINGLFGINGAVDCTIEDGKFYNTLESIPTWWDQGASPWFDCNSFLGSTQNIIFRNIEVAQTRLVNGTTMNVVFGRADTTNIKVYDCIFSKPDGNLMDNGQAINIEAANAEVDGVIVIGSTDPWFLQWGSYYAAGIALRDSGASNGIVKNTTCEMIKVAPEVITENNICIVCR